MIEVHTVRNRQKDGKNILAFICDDEQFSVLMSDIVPRYECRFIPATQADAGNKKPTDAATSAGCDSSMDTSANDGEKESSSDDNRKLSPGAIAEIKKLATDSERGKAVKWLLSGKIVMTKNTKFSYIWITSLRSQLNRIAGAEIICKIKTHDRTGRPRMGYHLICPALFRD